mgnify:CR=1 FL=1
MLSPRWSNFDQLLPSSIAHDDDGVKVIRYTPGAVGRVGSQTLDAVDSQSPIDRVRSSSPLQEAFIPRLEQTMVHTPAQILSPPRIETSLVTSQGFYPGFDRPTQLGPRDSPARRSSRYKGGETPRNRKSPTANAARPRWKNVYFPENVECSLPSSARLSPTRRRYQSIENRVSRLTSNRSPQRPNPFFFQAAQSPGFCGVSSMIGLRSVRNGIAWVV